MTSSTRPVSMILPASRAGPFPAALEIMLY
jgi:hypothetical protein